MQIFLAGFLSGLGLIAAIGAQNAFVLRQGLLRGHVALVVAICAISDAILVALGVAGAQGLAQNYPWVQPLMLWAGVAFLFVYGGLRFRAARTGGQGLEAGQGIVQSARIVVLTCLAFTWLNPHVWLDTVALLGSLSAQYAPAHWTFGAGAMSASVVFFSALGFGARYLAPILRRPGAWVWVEAGIGVVMWAIALKLLLRALA
ncbi:MAG: LysE/ArgO family amino acid transporter [Roseinatronobacter sp.]